MHGRPTAKWWLLAVVPLLALAAGLGPVRAQQPAAISVIDVAGDLSPVQVILDNYKKAFPNKVKEIRTQRATEPELPAKIKAQQDAGRLDINLIMTGQSAASQLVAAWPARQAVPDVRRHVPARRTVSPPRMSWLAATSGERRSCFSCTSFPS